MSWKTVVYDTSRQDQITSTAKFDEQNNLQSVTQTYVCTYIAVDDGASGQPDTYSALTAVDPSTSLAIPAAGDTDTVPGAGIIVWNITQVMPRRNEKSPFVFEVQVSCERKFQIQPPDTTKWNVTVSTSGEKTTQEAYQDKDGNDVVNTAGEAYDPSVKETNYDEILKVSYNTTDPPDLSDYRGYVNSDTVTISIQGLSRTYTARQLLCDEADMTTTFTLADTTPVWKVSLSFIGRTDTFQEDVLDRGYNQLMTVGGTPSLVACRDLTSNQPLSAPALLDASGVQLAVGGTPHYSTFKIEPETALSGLFTGL